MIRRFKRLEDALIDLSEEVSGVKASIASINGKLAVETRKTRRATSGNEAILLKELLGGDVMAMSRLPDDSPQEEVNNDATA